MRLSRASGSECSRRCGQGSSDKGHQTARTQRVPVAGSATDQADHVAELLAVLERSSRRPRTRRRMTLGWGRWVRYAIATGRAHRDPSPDLSGTWEPIQEKRLASLTEFTEALTVGSCCVPSTATKASSPTRAAPHDCRSGRIISRSSGIDRSMQRRKDRAA